MCEGAEETRPYPIETLINSDLIQFIYPRLQMLTTALQRSPCLLIYT